jgi:hypothetical protein
MVLSTPTAQPRMALWPVMLDSQLNAPFATMVVTRVGRVMSAVAIAMGEAALNVQWRRWGR